MLKFHFRTHTKACYYFDHFNTLFDWLPSKNAGAILYEPDSADDIDDDDPDEDLDI